MPASTTLLPPQGFPPLGPLTKPKDPVQGHVLSNVKQGRHGQLVSQAQSGSKIEVVTWGTGGHLVSGMYLGRAKRESHWRRRFTLEGGSWPPGRAWPGSLGHHSLVWEQVLGRGLTNEVLQ